MLKASFRGAEFFVESAEDDVGRQTVVHEFVGTDEVVAEDTGPVPKRFSLDVHLVGDNYAADLQALEDALDLGGPGELIHPYRGSIQASVEGRTGVTQSTREGGMARLSILFVRADVPLAPVLDLDTGLDLNTKLDITLGLLDAAELDIDGPSFLRTAAAAVLIGADRLTGKLTRINAQVSSQLGVITDLSSAVDAFTSSINQLLNAPAQLALAVQGLVNSLFAAMTAADAGVDRGDTATNVARAALALASAQDLSATGIDAVPVTTSTRQTEQDNQDLLLDLVELAAIAEGMRSIAAIPLDNTDQADNLVSELLDSLDGIIDRGTFNDGVDQALRDQRASFLVHMRKVTVDLVGLGEHTPPTDVPALVLAWFLYSDANRDLEIAERNNSEDPGSLHGGVTLQVVDA